jgi:hypothetical protein
MVATRWGVPVDQVAACFANLAVLRQLAHEKRAALGLAPLEIQLLMPPSKLGPSHAAATWGVYGDGRPV